MKSILFNQLSFLLTVITFFLMGKFEKLLKEVVEFIKSHLNSLFCCDFLTVETVFQSRIYIFFIMNIKSRKIVQFGLTKNPVLSFIRNQLSGFMYDRDEK